MRTQAARHPWLPWLLLALLLHLLILGGLPARAPLIPPAPPAPTLELLIERQAPAAPSSTKAIAPTSAAPPASTAPARRPTPTAPPSAPASQPTATPDPTSVPAAARATASQPALPATPAARSERPAATRPTPRPAPTAAATPSPARHTPAATEAAPRAGTLRFDSTRLAAEVAGISREPALASRTGLRVHRLDARSSLQDKGGWYREEWRRKVERVGNLNYPDEARRQGLYGSLRLRVAINRDGSLREVTLLESSGHPLLDQAALRIVRLAAPFSPFSADLADVDVLEIIRTWRFTHGNRLASP